MGLYVNNAFVPCVKINSAISPTGTFSISSNSIYNVYTYSSISVNVVDNLEKRITTGVDLKSYTNSNITYVAPYALADQTASEINMPNVVEIGEGAFYNLHWCRSYSFPNCEIINESAFYDNHGNVGITSFYAPKVKIIKDNAFFGNNWTQGEPSVWSFPECTFIGKSAFRNAYGAAIILSKCSYIDDNGLYGMRDITSLNLPSCKYIGISAFGYCTKLATISMPACISAMANAFEYCSALTNISLPNCTTLGSSAFISCSALTSVNLPKVTILNSSTFSGCIALTNVSLPLCQSVGNRTFYQCSALSTISLPVCSYIASSAFISCTSLKSIYLMSTSLVSLASTNVFSNTPISVSTLIGAFGSIYVPSSLLASYKAAARWSTYSARFVGV